MDRKLSKPLVFFDEAVYDSQTNNTRIRGWGVDQSNQAQLVPSSDNEGEIISFQRELRPDINMRLSLFKFVKFGFNFIVKGDWRNRLGEIWFQSDKEPEDTEYLGHFIAPAGKKVLLKKIAGNLTRKKGFQKQPLKKENLISVQSIDAVSSGPLISIVIPVYNIKEDYLRECIESIVAQTYKNWQLCLTDDCSTDPSVRKVLSEYECKYSRIKVVYMDHNSGISATTNKAIEISDGEFIAFMDDDDTLDPLALGKIAAYLKIHPETDFIYTDEMKISEKGEFQQAYLKPDWNPILLDFHNYITHFTIIKRDLLEKKGLLNPEYDGAQDYDLIYRTAHAANKVGHIPEMLYHWRAIEGSVAQNPEAKNYAYTAGCKAVKNNLSARRIPADVSIGEFFGTHNVEYEPNIFPPVSLIFSGKFNQDDAMRQLAIKDFADRTEYPELEIVAVNTQPFMEDPRIIFITDNADRSNAFLKNYAAKFAHGKFLVFIDDEVLPFDSQWLKKLINSAKLEQTGAVGPKICNEQFCVIDAGVSIKDERRYLPQIKRSGFDIGLDYRLVAPQNVYAVSNDCLLVKKDAFMNIGGFDESLEPFEQDIDLALRLKEIGLESVFDPRTIMIKAIPENIMGQNISGLRGKYSAERLRDSYINPNLTVDTRLSRCLNY